MATYTISLPGFEEQLSTKLEPQWLVKVFNNEHNTYDEVIEALMMATGCTLEEAEIETWEIDHLGHSVVHCDREDVCHSVAAIIRRIGIEVTVSQDL